MNHSITYIYIFQIANVDTCKHCLQIFIHSIAIFLVLRIFPITLRAQESWTKAGRSSLNPIGKLAILYFVHILRLLADRFSSQSQTMLNSQTHRRPAWTALDPNRKLVSEVAEKELGPETYPSHN